MRKMRLDAIHNFERGELRDKEGDNVYISKDDDNIG